MHTIAFGNAELIIAIIFFCMWSACIYLIGWAAGHFHGMHKNIQSLEDAQRYRIEAEKIRVKNQREGDHKKIVIDEVV